MGKKGKTVGKKEMKQASWHLYLIQISAAFLEQAD